MLWFQLEMPTRILGVGLSEIDETPSPDVVVSRQISKASYKRQTDFDVNGMGIARSAKLELSNSQKPKTHATSRKGVCAMLARDMYLSHIVDVFSQRSTQQGFDLVCR